MYLLGLAIHSVQTALSSVRLAYGVGVAGAQKQFLCGSLFLTVKALSMREERPAIQTR